MIRHNSAMYKDKQLGGKHSSSTENLILPLAIPNAPNTNVRTSVDNYTNKLNINQVNDKLPIRISTRASNSSRIGTQQAIYEEATKVAAERKANKSMKMKLNKIIGESGMNNLGSSQNQ